MSNNLPRSQITVPICPVQPVTDQILLTAATDPTKTFYIPRYLLVEESLPGKHQFRIILNREAQRRGLTVFLAPTPASELGTAARDAQPIELQTLKLALQYRIPGSSTVETLPFQTVNQIGEELQAFLQVDSLAKLSQLTVAITDSHYTPTLVAHRQVKIALPAKSSFEGQAPEATDSERFAAIITLRCEVLRQRVEIARRAVMEIQQPQIEGLALSRLLIHLSNQMTALWQRIAGFGLGTDPHKESIQVSSSGLISPAPTPTFGISGSAVGIGCPRLYERALKLTKLSATSLQAKTAQFAQSVQAYANPGIYPHREFSERVFKSQQQRRIPNFSEYASDLQQVDQWLLTLFNDLNQVLAEVALLSAPLSLSVSPIPPYTVMSLPVEEEYDIVTSLATLRSRDLLKLTQNVRNLLRSIQNGQIGQSGPLNRINDLNNNLVDLWSAIAGYGLATEPFPNSIQVSSSGFTAAKPAPDFGYDTAHKSFGMPRLYERFLQLTGVTGATAQTQRQAFNRLVQPYANSEVYPHQAFYERAYNAYRIGTDLGTPQYQADLQALNIWLTDLENILQIVPKHFTANASLPISPIPISELEAVSTIATLRLRMLLQAVHNTLTQLQPHLTPSQGQTEGQRDARAFQNAMNNLWAMIAGYGLGTEPVESVQITTFSFMDGKKAPDFGISGAYTAFGIPRLYDRFLHLAGIATAEAKTQSAHFSVDLVGLFCKPEIYPYGKFVEQLEQTQYQQGDLTYFADANNLLLKLQEILQAALTLFQLPELTEPLFREETLVLEQVIEPRPFVFPYLADALNSETNLILRPVTWKGESYSYYQDPIQSHLFKYLPHSFKLARLASSPSYPDMSIQFLWQDQASEPDHVQLTYRAVPCVDQQRRMEEKVQLKTFTSREPEFEPLVARSYLQIKLNPTLSDTAVHKKDPIDLRQDFEDTLVLKFSGFIELFNRLFSTASILKGDIVVEADRQEVIPVVFQINDLGWLAGSEPSNLVEPDRESLLNHLLADQPLIQTKTTITVSTFSYLFDSPSDQPDNPVTNILVDFLEYGGVISLTSEKLSEKITLEIPIKERILSQSSKGTFRYKTIPIRKSGKGKESAELQGDSDIFITEV